MDFTNFIFSNAFVLLFLPIWVALLITLNFTVQSFRSKRFTSNLTLISTGICAVYSILLLYATSSLGIVATDDVFDWIRIGNISFSFGFLLDNLSALFLVIYNFVCFFIQLFSYSYMKDDEGFHRYFVLLNLFNFSISGLFVSPNLIQMFLFLALTGACSHLLTGFWFKEKSVSEASQKAYLISKFADCCLLLGIVALIYFAFNYFPSFNFSSLNFSSLYDLGQNIIPYSTEEGFLIICLVLFIGIMAKSFQFPFHIKATSTTEAPVTIGALINSTTAVSAGVYLAIRFLPMFSLSGTILNIILYTGLVTAVYCAILSLFQSDIKKIFACLACSQMGLIFCAIGLQAVSSAILYLLLTSFPIALLFLLSGLISSLTDSEDINYIGGLRKKYPVLTVLYLTGILSLSGIFFSGVFPKTQILNLFIQDGLFKAYGFILFSVFITTVCCVKTYLMIFEGAKNYSETTFEISIQEKISVWALALPTIFLGLIINSNFHLLFDVVSKNELSFKGLILFFVINIMAVILGLVLYKFGKLSNIIPYKISKYFEEGFIVNKIYKIFMKYFYEPVCKIVDFIDSYLIKGIVKGITLIFKLFGIAVSKMQTGSVQTYLLWSFLGVLAAIGLVVFYYFKLKGY